MRSGRFIWKSEVEFTLDTRTLYNLHISDTLHKMLDRSIPPIFGIKLTEIIEWLTLKVIRTLQHSVSTEKPQSHKWYI
jgi:hypothetical protein